MVQKIALSLIFVGLLQPIAAAQNAGGNKPATGGAKGGGGAPVTGVPTIGGQSAGTRMIPNPEYFSAFQTYYSGDYRSAIAAFQDAAKGGVRSTDGRWVDSICYHCMIGECYYQLGDLAQSL